MALNRRQLLFVKEYLVDKNATRAAKAAGYSEATAHSIGSENLGKPEIAAAIDQGLKAQIQDAEKRAAKKGVTKEKWLAEIARIAFSDMDDFARIDEKGKLQLLSSGERKKGRSKVIKKITQSESSSSNQFGGSESFSQGLELWNKEKALELIGRHFGWLKDVIQTEKPPETKPVDEAEARAMLEKIKNDC